MKFSQMNASEVTTIRQAGRKPAADTGKQVTPKYTPRMAQQTPQAARLPKRNPYGDQNVHPATKHSKQYMDHCTSGYSDDGSVFDAPHELLRKESILSPKLFDIADFNSINKKSTPINRSNGLSPRQTLSSAKIQQYVELDGEGDLTEILSETCSEDGVPLRLLPKNSGTSWPHDDDDEKDPFDSLVPDYDEYNMQANLARDKQAKMSANIRNIVASIRITQTEDVLFDASEELVSNRLFVKDLC